MRSKLKKEVKVIHKKRMKSWRKSRRNYLTDSPDFDFKKEIERLPFKMKIGEVEMTREQQVRFINLVYDNQYVFSLHDEDLGYCDRLKHTIPMTTDKPIYLPH